MPAVMTLLQNDFPNAKYWLLAASVGAQEEIPEGPYVLLLWNQVPKKQYREGLLGPNSIMVVYMDPLGIHSRDGPVANAGNPYPISSSLVVVGVVVRNTI